MSTKVVCPDCGGVIGELSPGDTPCRCLVDIEPPLRSDAPATQNDSSNDTVVDTPAKKVCISCGKDVAGHRRVKDSRGYLCYACAKAERAAEREGKVRCAECRKLVKPEGLVAFHGKMICRKCFGDHQETARFKKKVSTKGYEEHEKRTLLILSSLFVVLGLIVAYSWFFKMRGGDSASPSPAPPANRAAATTQTAPAKNNASRNDAANTDPAKSDATGAMNGATKNAGANGPSGAAAGGTTKQSGGRAPSSAGD